jgi:hypothetical protein
MKFNVNDPIICMALHVSALRGHLQTLDTKKELALELLNILV